VFVAQIIVIRWARPSLDAAFDLQRGHPRPRAEQGGRGQARHLVDMHIAMTSSDLPRLSPKRRGYDRWRAVCKALLLLGLPVSIDNPG